MSSQEKSITVWKVTEPYIELDCQLGEGPYFEESTRTLRFVDIIGKKLHRFHVDQGLASLKSQDTEDAIGVTSDIHGDDTRLIVGAKYGFALVDRTGRNLEYVARSYEQKPKAERMRANDGAIDPAGRFLAGMMTDPTLHEVENEGALLRLERSTSDPTKYTIATVLAPVKIPNGLGWTANGRTMFHTDSPTYTIWAYDYDPETGAATNRRPWFVMPHLPLPPGATYDALPPDVGPSGSEPDGFAMDVNGDLWSAVYGAGKVLRLRDIDGQGRGVVIGCIHFPAANITCPRFVDEDLIVTSAKGGGSYGGCVFRVHVGVRGAPTRAWRAEA